jgi:hypothetical protein
MTRLLLEARPAGLTDYSLYVDGALVRMDRRHRGAIICDGGVQHSLVYALHGNSGGSLSITLSCRGVEVGRVRGVRIAGTGAPRAAGRMTFRI